MAYSTIEEKDLPPIKSVDKAIIVNIGIKYDPTDEMRPYNYELSLPDEMDDFLVASALTSRVYLPYTGKSVGYASDVDAKGAAEREAERLVARYKNYLLGKQKATSYEYIVKV